MITPKDNLCDSCTNVGCIFQSGIVRKECAFYMPQRVEPDSCGNYVVQELLEIFDKYKIESDEKEE